MVICSNEQEWPNLAAQERQSIRTYIDQPDRSHWVSMLPSISVIVWLSSGYFAGSVPLQFLIYASLRCSYEALAG